MATWHQQRAGMPALTPGWTVVTDPPNRMRCSMHFGENEERARQYMENLSRNNPENFRHSYLVHKGEYND